MALGERTAGAGLQVLLEAITVDDLAVAVHFVKENAVVSKESRSSEKFMHGIKVLMAKNYVDNLSEEVKKGLREKAAQGHWPTVAHVGYVNNRETRRIDVDAVRGPLVTKVFELYAAGDYSLSALRTKARDIGLTHRLGNRPMTKSELHRMLLQNPIYTGDFRWLGEIHHGSHTPLISHETFARVQAVLQHKPRGRYQKHRHPFMGLLTCSCCDCAMTAERRKARYVCLLPLHGLQGPLRESLHPPRSLSELLSATVDAIQIPEEVATSSQKRSGRRSRTPRRSAARRRSGSKSSTARSSQSSIAATRTIWRV
jgi:hypothetical protein